MGEKEGLEVDAADAAYNNGQGFRTMSVKDPLNV
jgi:hypothetical protein